MTGQLERKLCVKVVSPYQKINQLAYWHVQLQDSVVSKILDWLEK